MLSIKFKSGVERIWHIHEPNPITYYEVNAIDEIQADGDELEYIHNMFLLTHSLPIPKGRVIRWFGDYAKLIVGNL
jgi:hypothetical protein